MDMQKVKNELSYMAVGDHMGDVNNALPDLVEALDFDRPEWCSMYSHYVMPWDMEEHVASGCERENHHAY